MCEHASACVCKCEWMIIICFANDKYFIVMQWRLSGIDEMRRYEYEHLLAVIKNECVLSTDYTSTKSECVFQFMKWRKRQEESVWVARENMLIFRLSGLPFCGYIISLRKGSLFSGNEKLTVAWCKTQSMANYTHTHIRWADSRVGQAFSTLNDVGHHFNLPLTILLLLTFGLIKQNNTFH